MPAGWTSRARIGTCDWSPGWAAVPARRARPRDARMPWVGAPPRVATRAHIANRYHWVAVFRADRHDYSSDAGSGGMMAVTAELVAREHRVSEIAEASRSGRPVSPELGEDVVAQNPLEHPLDGPQNSHNLPPCRDYSCQDRYGRSSSDRAGRHRHPCGVCARVARRFTRRASLRFQLPGPSAPPRRQTPPGHPRSGS